MFGQKLKEIRKMKGMLQDELAKLLGTSKATVSEWESGKRSPDIERLEGIAKALDISPTDFFDPPETNADTPWQMRLASSYRSANEITQRAACRVLEIEHIEIFPKLKKKPREEEINIFTTGLITYAPLCNAGITERMNFPVELVPEGADCGVIITGDSMEPNFSHGEMAWVRYTPEVRQDEVGIFIINNKDAVCKRADYDANGRITWLVSDNPEAEDIKVSDIDHLWVFGRVIGIHNIKETHSLPPPNYKVKA